jgi:hypothetical protein
MFQSELLYVDSREWAALTIGTGLGNVRFSTNEKCKGKKRNQRD